ncbi:hypothetical protein GCM10011365_00800 [Marinicella pacifica]|uniref:Uncharacterized protein n=1 Tax=Marinicella pacifica TaxID=1171543 RepID=A0A917CBY7_9GAMM|nr:hypothetical protein [Marinicella pacifica]GGF83672.1 hypothetical protein GCM10011365_00800 [Marinicella pacifica]
MQIKPRLVNLITHRVSHNPVLGAIGGVTATGIELIAQNICDVIHLKAAYQIAIFIYNKK